MFTIQQLRQAYADTPYKTALAKFQRNCAKAKGKNAYIQHIKETFKC